MAFQVSPGVQVKEIDATGVVPAVSSSIGGFAGSFNWGPCEQVVTVGSEMDVYVVKIDKESLKIALSLKRLTPEPWELIKDQLVTGRKIVAKVTKITTFGAFVRTEHGVEGLVHVSEIDWTNKNIHPSKVVEMEQKIKVMILEIDEERRRISLGIKQCFSNPWSDFESSKKKGDRVSGTIKSITDFGIFIGLEGGIDGLVHLSDIYLVNTQVQYENVGKNIRFLSQSRFHFYLRTLFFINYLLFFHYLFIQRSSPKRRAIT